MRDLEKQRAHQRAYYTRNRERILEENRANKDAINARRRASHTWDACPRCGKGKRATAKICQPCGSSLGFRQTHPRPVIDRVLDEDFIG